MFKDKNLLSVDIGSSSIKVIELEVSKSSFIVNEIYSIDNLYDMSGSEVYYEIFRDIKELNKEKGIKAKNMVLTTSIHKVLEDVIKIDLVDKKSFQNLIEIEYIKNYSNIKNYEDYLFDYEVLGIKKDRGKGYNSCLLVGVTKELANTLLDSSKSSGFKVLRISSEISSLNDVVKLCENKISGILLHIGNENSKFIVYKENTIIFYRKIDFGYNKLVRELNSHLNCPKEIIIKHIKENGMEKDNLPLILSEQGYEEYLNLIVGDFLNEIYDTLNHVKVNHDVDIDSFYLSGGFSGYVGMKELISNFLKKDVNYLINNLDQDKILNESEDYLEDIHIVALGSIVSEGKYEKNKSIT